ncbi:preprotein translocase subunit SecY [Candidatus Woesearchaeota archaeon]|nr:preprotein translocase subunit SecY [Candidatus Woesearchaeota archaeon]
MNAYDKLLEYLPEVVGPTQKKLAFNEKLKWTLFALLSFFILGVIPLFGLGENALSRFEFLSVILGASFGSIISLGIGPLVTASIVLQLLNGASIVKFDLNTHNGKRRFQGTQKLLALFFILLEGAIYVQMGGLSPAEGFSPSFLIFQLLIGGVLIMFLDEVISKWGFGSGISLFIAAGVSQSVFVRTLSWLPSPNNPEISAGAIPALFQSISRGDPLTATLLIASIVSTLLVFAIAVYSQAMKVEIPLSFGRVRGHGMRWPLSFIYTSNIPVILVAALLANLQLWARLLQGFAETSTSSIIKFFSIYILGQTETANAGHGIVQWVNPPNLVSAIINGSVSGSMIVQALGYMGIMILGAVVFSIFWVQTSGSDAKSQAKQILRSGLQLPGFRKDERVLERVLNRYIWPLTVMGAATVGFLAAFADLSGALSSGTGLLLTVMIVYKLYEEIAKQHMMDMNPMMRKFME